MSEPQKPADVPSLEGIVVAGKYRVVRLIGSGGMGTVWEGIHTHLRTRVAIKFIKPAYLQNDEARARFEIEARAAAKLQSKHAVHVFDYGVGDNGLPYIVMEFLEGESLSETVVRRGPLPSREVATIIAQAAHALDKAHASRVVHRDLKPDNIFLTKSDDANDVYGYVVKLVDFGIAKIFDETSPSGTPMGGPTKEGTVIGTPNFMSPEQLTVGGAPGPLTDLWSLGACAFSAMTGRIPFEGEVLGDIVLKVCAAPLPVPSNVYGNVPPGFDAWFARACAREPERRFQSGQELSQSLSAVCGVTHQRIATLNDEQVQYVLKPQANPMNSETLSSIPMPSSMSARTALLAGLVLGVAVMVGIAGLIAWQQMEDSPQPSPPPSLEAQDASPTDAHP